MSLKEFLEKYGTHSVSLLLRDTADRPQSMNDPHRQKMFGEIANALVDALLDARALLSK